MKARQAKGWTQQELATKMSAKVSVVQEYENGKCVPQPQVIQQLQRALGVQVCYPTTPSLPYCLENMP